MAVLQIGRIIICVPCDDILTEKMFKLFTLQLFLSAQPQNIDSKIWNNEGWEVLKIMEKTCKLIFNTEQSSWHVMQGLVSTSYQTQSDLN